MMQSKKILSFVLAALILILSVGASLAIDTNESNNGKCGENVNWSFDESSGALTLSGAGSMYSYIEHDPTNPTSDFDSLSTTIKYNDAPWKKIAANIKSLILLGNIELSCYTFEDCVNLKALVLGKEVTESSSSWHNIPFVEKISVSAENAVFSSDEQGCLYSKYKSRLIQCPQNNTCVDIIIPKSVRIIYQEAFCKCKNLEKVVISHGTTTITHHAFAYCDSLLEIHIPSSVTMIGYNAFEASSSEISSNRHFYYSGNESEWEALNTYTGKVGDWVSVANLGIGKATVHYNASCITHTPAKAVIEFETPATEEQEGFFEKVIYCSDCGMELSRTTIRTSPLTVESSENNSTTLETQPTEKPTNQSTTETNNQTKEDEPEENLNFFQRIIQWFRDLFARLFGI